MGYWVSVHDFLYGHLRQACGLFGTQQMGLSTRFFVWSLKDIFYRCKTGEMCLSTRFFVWSLKVNYYRHTFPERSLSTRFFVWSLKVEVSLLVVNMLVVSVHDFLYGHLRRELEKHADKQIQCLSTRFFVWSLKDPCEFYPPEVYGSQYTIFCMVT